MDVAQPRDEPLAVAARFLSALDSRDWDAAASLVATDTISDLQRWITWFLRHERVETLERPSDTQFASVRDSLGIGSLLEAERMTPVALLANSWLAPTGRSTPPCRVPDSTRTAPGDDACSGRSKAPLRLRLLGRRASS